jgi:hypothetical protein
MDEGVLGEDEGGEIDGMEIDPERYEAGEREFLREIEDRKSSRYPRLLMWAAPRGQNAKIYPSLINSSAMIADYFEFARNHPMPIAPHEQDLDRRILPLLFVYRHATELALKHLIGVLIHLIRQREPAFHDVIPEDHRLGSLLGKARAIYERAAVYLNEMGTVEFVSTQAQRFIGELDQVDPTGEAFRYARTRRNKAGQTNPQIEDERDVSVEALRAGMLHIEKEVLWLIGMIENTIDLYDQGTADMRADVGW